MKNTEESKIYFTSDLHFGHDAIIKLCNRPFESVSEMDEQLIQNWNKTVRKQDKVYVLGDFFMYHKKAKLREIVSRLNGTKILVKGNHDMTDKEMENLGFSFVCRSATIMIANELVNMSHYPYKQEKWITYLYFVLNKYFPKKFFKPRVFRDMLIDDGKFLLHGHTHSTFRTSGRMIHVGTDAWKYKPVPLHEIGNLIGKIKRDEPTGFKRITQNLNKRRIKIQNVGRFVLNRIINNVQ